MHVLKQNEEVFQRNLYILLSIIHSRNCLLRKGVLLFKINILIKKKEMLLRVIGIETSEKFEVITVYKTSKSSKYWVEGG